MEDKDIDKILKEKLKGKITASPEMENKIKAKIQEQKVLSSKAAKKKQRYKIFKPLISVAAVVLIIFAVGIRMDDNIINNILTTDTSVAVIKSIEPTNLQAGIIANNSEFIIKTDENASKKSVQNSLYIEPALEYSIEKTGNENEYKLTFKQNIPDNTILKLQYVKDQMTQNSWAYQTANKLSVVGGYPNHNESYASPNTIIEVELSYANVENFEENVSISPNVEGNWEHLGKVWKLTPNKPLETGKYTVTVNKGITSGEETLESEYSFSFIVAEENTVYDKIKYSSYSMDGISTYKNDELVKIYYTFYGEEVDIAKVQISKFEEIDEFIKYLDTNNPEKAKLVGEYEFQVDTENNYIALNKSLPNGYYAASVLNRAGQEAFNCPIQINSLNAYAVETERDVVVWVADENGLAKNIKVEYSGKEEKTNSDGIAKFIGIADGSEKIKYAKIGNDIDPLIVGLYSYKLDNYPSSYLYTDRPVYKNTDTIKIWGFVPTTQFFDEIEDEFYIQLSEGERQKIEVGKDGNFNYEIKLDNYIDDEYTSVYLYYKEEMIAFRSISIENYGLENYSYEIISDKNYAYAGSSYEFDVRVKHVTGILVPNKAIVVKYGDEILRGRTGEDGIAHFSINIVDEGDDYYVSGKTIEVYNGNAEEYVTSETYKTIYGISRNVYGDVTEKGNIYELKLNTLLKDKEVNVSSYNLKELYDTTYDAEVKVNLVESVYERFEVGYAYDEYTKQMQPQYNWVDSENVIPLTTLKTQNGVVKFDANNLEMKSDTEDKNYSYTLQFEYKDADGKLMKSKGYLYQFEIYGRGKLGYFYDEFDRSSDEVYTIPRDINTYAYYTFRYFLECDDDYEYSIGDKVKYTLNEAIMDGKKPIKNEGEILRIVAQEDVSNIQIIKDDNFDYTFTEKDFPGCKITTAYYYQGRFYRMPVQYLDFREEDRKLDVEIKADKEKYKPGEEVEITVKTSNNGKPVKTFVNVSVVNEAVFALEDDMTNILDEVYEDKTYPIYTYSSHMDYLDNSDGGGGGGGEPRGEFADTAHFETVYTNNKGEAKVKFKLPDNVTSYRVTAHGANEDMYVGVNYIDIVSTLDFFVQSNEPRNVKTTDDLVLNATSIADENYDVEYEFTIKELNKTLKATGVTNNMATVNFGKLDYGTYHAVIKGKHGDQEDAIEYPFNIIESAQEVKNKTEIKIDENAKISPTKNPICLEIYNKNMSQYLKYLDFIAKTQTTRLDTQIAYNEMIRIKNQYYQTDEPINKFDMSGYVGLIGFKNLKARRRRFIINSIN